MADFVIVADMVRGFLEEGYPLYCGPVARAIIPKVRRALEKELARDAYVLFARDNHAPDDAEFRMFAPHRVRGAVETEVILELRDLSGEYMPKTRYIAFFDTPLAERIREKTPERIVMVGVCADICVLHTTAEARSYDYEVAAPTDCVATFNPEAHPWGPRHIREILGARLLTADEL